MDLYLLKYNNYYNRILKKESSLAAYITVDSYITTVNNVSFKPNDGVNTEQIINYSGQAMPDYAILVDNNNSNEIVSRWFVIECARLRNGQYKLTLRRDVLVDHYNAIVDAPIFVEKATLDDSDPMIFNKEEASFNKIKTSETLLKDKTNIPWLVAYLPKDNGSQTDFDITFAAEDEAIPWTGTIQQYIDNVKNQYNTTSTVANLVYDTIDTQDIYFRFRNNTYDYVAKFRFNYDQYSDDYSLRYIITNHEAITSEVATTVAATGDQTFNVARFCRENLASSLDAQPVALATQMAAWASDYANTAEDLADLQRYDGKLIQTTNGTTVKNYRLRVVRKPAPISSLAYVRPTFSDVDYKSYITSFSGYSISSSYNSVTKIEYSAYDIEYTEVSTSSSSVSISGRTALIDAPYCMAVLPYGNISINGYDMDKTLSMAIMNAMIIKYAGAGWVYDVQLLPYCPLQESIQDDGSLLVDNFVYIKDRDDQNIGVMPFAIKSQGTFDIDYSIPITNKKVQNQTDSWRVCSPNYNGSFEFNAVMNDGCSKFNVDFNYKPYTPYIHVNPDFNGLYGQDFNDARGLICGGDFSLTMVNDKWSTYEIENKNYQNMFDRQIQNMEVTNRLNKIANLTSAAAGTLQGAASGAVTGMMMGGPVGGAIGGAIGGAASIAGAVGDEIIRQKQFEESKSYATDTFAMQLDNIQALPMSLTKVSAINANNKVFPFVEYYTCTEVEKQAFEDKLKYNGMTVGRIGKMSDFIRSTESFFRGRLIRLESIADDFHMVSTIAEELNKGVFI